MDQNLAILKMLSVMLNKNDVQHFENQTVEEVIEQIKETPTGEISDNLIRSLREEEYKTQDILNEILKNKKLNIEVNNIQPECRNG